MRLPAHRLVRPGRGQGGKKDSTSPRKTTKQKNKKKKKRGRLLCQTGSRFINWAGARDGFTSICLGGGREGKERKDN